jgi:hypothetical protein
MADSLVILDRIKNATSLRTYGGQFTVTRSGTNEQHGRFPLGTTEETITVSADIGDLGVVFFTNHDSTNYAEVGTATGDYYTVVPAGQTVRTYGPLVQATFYVKANTASVDFEYSFWQA